MEPSAEPLPCRNLISAESKRRELTCEYYEPCSYELLFWELPNLAEVDIQRVTYGVRLMN